MMIKDLQDSKRIDQVIQERTPVSPLPSFRSISLGFVLVNSIERVEG